MEQIKEELASRVDEDQEVYMEVTSDDVKEHIAQLKSGTSDSDAGLGSGHLLNGTDYQNRLLSILMNCSFKNSYMAECLKVSTRISIPKDYRSSLIKSDNYMGICLCFGISKLFDIIMFKNNGDKLSTPSLQFAYKPGLSITMCTTVAKEVVQHNRNIGTDVHICLLDASKAFDRICFNKLFQ